MTAEEFVAIVEEVLAAPRTVPGRADTIKRAADAYAAYWVRCALVARARAEEARAS